MYVWQMNDGRWHISLKTNSRIKFAHILLIPEAFRLYDRGYEYELDARVAERHIRELLQQYPIAA